MEFFVRPSALVGDDRWPFIREHGAELLGTEVIVEREGVVAQPGPWVRVELPHVQQPWVTGVRYVAAVVFEALVGGTAFAIGETGQPKAWPQADREEELRRWILTPPPQSIGFLIPDEYEQAELRVRVDRELGEAEIDGLRRVLRSKCSRPDGGIRASWVEDGSTTIRVMYNFRYWEPGMPSRSGFDHWWLAAECMEAWTGGTVTWWCVEEMMKFDKGRRDAMLRHWPMQHIEDMRSACREGGRAQVWFFGRRGGDVVEIVAAQEDKVLLRCGSQRQETWLPYYRIQSCHSLKC